MQGQVIDNPDTKECYAVKPLLVYLGDITRTTPGAESQLHPLSIGYLKAYAQKVLGDCVDIQSTCSLGCFA